MSRNFFILSAAFAASLLFFSYIDSEYLANYELKLVPEMEELIPSSLIDLKNSLLKKSPGNQQKNIETIQKDYLYAGENKTYLKRFFQKLNNLENKKSDTVRILHFGDSILWGDNLTYRLKKQFQKDYHDGGRGIVPPVQLPQTRLKDLENRTIPGQFGIYHLQHFFMGTGKIKLEPDSKPDLGFTGESSKPFSVNSSIKLSTPEGSKKWKLVQIFLRSPNSGNINSYDYQVNLKHDTGQLSRAVQLQRDSSRCISFRIPESSSVEIDFVGSKSPLPYVDAVNLETGEGLVYNTVIRMGIHMAWLDAVPARHFYYSLKESRPDLVIFQFGINESASLNAFREFTPELYRMQMRLFLTKIKENLPGTDLLLFGPVERQVKSSGKLIPMKENLQVINIQREEASSMGIAYFDTYNYLGGEGHMAGLVKNRLAMDDYTHLTLKGGDYIADIFYNSLTNTYKKYLGREAEIKKLEKLKLKKEKNIAIQFNSSAYLYFLLFIIIVTLAFSRLPKFRVFFLLLASYYFYATWKLWPLMLIISSTMLDYFCGIYIQKMRLKLKRGTRFLILSLAGNLGLLFVFKYFDFLSSLAEKVLAGAGFSVNLPLMEVVLPVGISFYTFQTLSYTIDVWRGQMKPEKNFFKFAMYVSFFPQLVAGPIVRAKDFIPGFNRDNVHFRVDAEKVSAALFLILTGLVKKIGADWLAVSIIDRVYDNPGMFTSAETLAAVYAYGLQIYGDFSGYTDIALGSAMLLGYNLTENFNRPYASVSISDFWRRWHISLGSWFRDYLYISLGGNRKRVFFNLFITMFLCGLWHGAGINFVIWGVYHGIFLMLERYLKISISVKNSLTGILRKFITFHIVIFGWIIFRSASWNNFMGIIDSISKLNFSGQNLDPVLVSVIMGFYIFHLTPVSWKETMGNIWHRLAPPVQGFATALVFVFLYNITMSDVRPFIYFQF